MKFIIRLSLLFGGLIFFGWFVYQANPGEVLKAFSRLGWFLPLLLVPYGFVYIADTFGWKFAFGTHLKHKLTFIKLFYIRWAGEAVNNVIPSAYIGGEAVKIYLLHKKGVSAATATSGVVVGKTLQTFSQLMFITSGAFAFSQLAAFDSVLRKSMLLIFTVALLLVFTLFWLQIQGMFSNLLRLFQKLHIHITMLETRKEKLAQIDRQIREFYQEDRKHFIFSTGAYLCGWILDTLEIFLAAYLLKIPISWTQALAVEAFLGVAKFMGLFVPGALGIQESGIVFLCRTAGLPDAFAVTYAILRRGREAIYAGIGWIIIYAEEATLSGLVNRVAIQKRGDL